jgi:thiol-disulfide isomerase/thioredoxin
LRCYNSLMKVLVFQLILLFSIRGVAQKPGDKIPPFKIVLADGQIYSVNNIKKDKPVVLIYFAPDCDHCKILMKDFFKRVADFAKAEVVMITYKPLKEVVQFITEYGINNYRNITVGTEVPIYYIRYYFNLANTPFTALYNKKGMLVYSYFKQTSVDDLLHRLSRVQ